MALSEPKLVWNPDNVTDVAESVGISSLSEEAKRALSQEVEFRVGQVIVEALRFMQQSKRTVLGTQDVAQALKVLDVEPLYGYESTRPLRFGEASLGPGQPLFYVEDEEVDFEKLINAPLPRVPRDVSFTAHWLSIEGVQPSIPQNPSSATTGPGPDTTSTSKPDSSASSLLPRGPTAPAALPALAGIDNPSFRPAVKHVISKELMLYFDKVRGAILDDSEDEEGEVSRLREAALASVRDDPGLHQLVPYFVQFIAEKVTHSIARLEVLRGMIRLAAALCANPSLFIEPYVNGLCAPVLTCLLSSKLGSEGRSATGERELEREKEQYQLRDLSASLLGLIAGKYGSSSSQLKPRLARTCLKYFLDPAKPLPVHYGAILGLLAVGGAEAARQLIVPNLRHYEAVLVKGQGDGKGVDVELVLGAVMRGVEGLRDGAGGVGRGQNGLGPDDMKAELEAFVGPLVAGRVLALGDEGLVREVLACRS